MLSPEKRALFAKMLKSKGLAADSAGRQIATVTRRYLTEAPLSSNQEGMWFLDQLDPGKATYNVPGAVRLVGPLDVEAFRQSLNAIVERHESLRTTFVLGSDGSPQQRIWPTAFVDLPVHDFQELVESEREERALKLATDESRSPFDLAEGPLIRAFLVQLGSEEHIFVFNIHHIVTDGWSMGLFTDELLELYESFCQSRPSTLDELPIQYSDYAVWQRELLQGDTLDGLVTYWRQQLDGSPPALDLPTVRPRPQVATSRGGHRSIEFSQSLTDQLATVTERQGTTPFVTMLAAFKALLHAYSRQSQIVVGSPFANRNRSEFEKLIGYFVNLVPLHTDLSGNPTFAELIDRVRKVTDAAHEHRELPFAKLVEQLQPPRIPGRQPIFQVEFTLLDLKQIPAVYGYGFRAPVQQSMKHANLSLTPVVVESGVSKFDLTVLMWDAATGLSGTFEYNTDLFDDSFITLMIDQFQILLRRALENTEIRLSDLIDMIGPPSQEKEAVKLQKPKKIRLGDLKAARRAKTIKKEN